MGDTVIRYYPYNTYYAYNTRYIPPRRITARGQYESPSINGIMCIIRIIRIIHNTAGEGCIIAITRVQKNDLRAYYNKNAYNCSVKLFIIIIL